MVIHIFQLKLYNGNMEIKTSDKYCILTPMSPTLDGYESLRLFDEISEHQNLNVGLDLSYVQECTIDFLEMLRNIKTVSLFNVPADVFALLNFMHMDKCVNLFVSELDFKANRRRILNRRFSIV